MRCLVAHTVWNCPYAASQHSGVIADWGNMSAGWGAGPVMVLQPGGWVPPTHVTGLGSAQNTSTRGNVKNAISAWHVALGATVGAIKSFAVAEPCANTNCTSRLVDCISV